MRLLDSATEYAPTVAGAAPTNNVRPTADETTGGTVTVNGLLAPNPIVLDGWGPLDPAGRVAQSSRCAALDVKVPLHFGAAEGQLFATGAITIGGGITGSNGVTKSGDGPLILQSDSTFSGPLTLNAGSNRIHGARAARHRSRVDCFQWRRTRISGGGPSRLRFARPIEVGSGFLSFSSALSMLALDGPISGAGGIIFGGPSGGGLFRLNTGNTHAGPTVLAGGTTEIVSDEVFGSGAVWIGSTLRLLGPWTTTRDIRVLANGIVDTNGFDASWDGHVSGQNSVLQKVGDGTLTISAPSSLSGEILIHRGTVALANAGQVLSAEIQIFPQGEFHLQKGPGGPQQLAVGTTVVFGGGTFRFGGTGPGVTKEVISEA